MPLIRYNGELTREQMITARHKILNNAKSLIIEAKLLYENHMIARSFFLASIASEEIGKYILVSSAIIELVKETINWKEFWKEIRNHKNKIFAISIVEDIFVSNDDNFTKPELIESSIPDIDEFKMANLYSDMFQNDFFDPNEIANERMTANLLTMAEGRLHLIESLPISEEDLRLMTKRQIEKSEEELKRYIKTHYDYEIT